MQQASQDTSSYSHSGSTVFTPPAASTTSVSSKQPAENTFTYPAYASFPALYTLQPNLTTRARQFELWSSLITSYCRHHSLFRISVSSPPADLFTKPSINRNLKQTEIRAVLEHMSRPENGAQIEWIPSTSKSEQSSACYVWWRTAEEWADMLYAWVEESGQKGAVLTLYELREGDAVRGKEWKVMDEGMLRKVLNVLVKKGKAQLFGQETGGEGVKFF